MKQRRRGRGHFAIETQQRKIFNIPKSSASPQWTDASFAALNGDKRPATQAASSIVDPEAITPPKKGNGSKISAASSPVAGLKPAELPVAAISTKAEEETHFDASNASFVAANKNKRTATPEASSSVDPEATMPSKKGNRRSSAAIIDDLNKRGIGKVNLSNVEVEAYIMKRMGEQLTLPNEGPVPAMTAKASVAATSNTAKVESQLDASNSIFVAFNENKPPATQPASSSVDPRATMPSKKGNRPKGAAAAPPVVGPKLTAPAPTATPPATTAEAPVAPISANADEESSFDVAQHMYGTAKNVWAWGKSVPVIADMLGFTEAIAVKVLDTTIHMDLPAIDQQAVTPQLKKFDDVIVTPVIHAVWKIIRPAVSMSEEFVVEPVLNEVVPRVLEPLGMLRDKKKEDRVQKEEEEMKAVIDASPPPEVVPAT